MATTFNTRSTKPKIMVEVCSKCHPYFTGSVKFVDAAGRVDKFNKKFQGTYGKGKKAAAAAAAALRPRRPSRRSSDIAKTARWRTDPVRHRAVLRSCRRSATSS